MDKFSDKLRAAYLAAGYTTQRQAAAALGWSAGRLNNYAQGRRPVDMDALEHIASTFRVEPAALLSGSGPVRHDLRSILRHVLITEDIDPAKADKISQIVPAIVEILAQQRVGADDPSGLLLALHAARQSLGFR